MFYTVKGLKEAWCLGMSLGLHDKEGSGKAWLERAKLESLFDVLHALKYKIIGPVVRNGAIVFVPIASVSELASGICDKQLPGKYSLVSENTNRLFSWNNGPQAIKPLLFKPEQPLWFCSADNAQLTFRQAPKEAEKIAVIGVRACDLAALALQDKHFMHGPYTDEFYKAQRENMLLIAVNCSRSGNQCFCVSTGTGPEANFYYDLLIDELDDGFLIDCGSDKGLHIKERLQCSNGTSEQIEVAQQQIALAAASQTKTMPVASELMNLYQLLSDDVWQEIESRCLACGNCTLVCPTCFCSKQESVNHIEKIKNGGVTTSQVRMWDSCFNLDHGHVFGKNYRPTIASRYRQWIIHKLVNWQTQYGRSGCVGCGRCVTWCPASIDLTEEVKKRLKQLPDKAISSIDIGGCL